MDLLTISGIKKYVMSFVEIWVGEREVVRIHEAALLRERGRSGGRRWQPQTDDSRNNGLRALMSSQ